MATDIIVNITRMLFIIFALSCSSTLLILKTIAKIHTITACNT